MINNVEPDNDLSVYVNDNSNKHMLVQCIQDKSSTVLILEEGSGIRYKSTYVTVKFEQ